MSLQQLRTFVSVAQEGGISRAARKLHISQPPLSRQIHNLEDELNAVLFERLPNGTRLTKAGEIFLPLAQSVLDAHWAASRAFTEDR